MHDHKHAEIFSRLHQQRGKLQLTGIYRTRIGKRDQQDIWIVDGNKIAGEIYPEWVMGGNDQRYRFNPVDEIWIDDRIGAEELGYTIEHELLERRLMQERGWSYDRAHNSALSLEKELRTRDEALAAKRSLRLHQLALSGALTERAQANADRLLGIHRVPAGRCGKAQIWIVDGPLVRSELHPDFCFGENGMRENFIPQDEIWLDSSMSAFETHFAILRQKRTYALSSSGVPEERAYDLALGAQLVEREKQAKLARKHELALPPVRYGARYKGVKKS